MRMINGEILTRVTIWIAIVGYGAGAFTFALSRNRHKWDSATRLVWTTACVALLTHVVCAFHFYHSWSHRAAYLDTARQTDEMIGLNWGGGLYVNYVVLMGWVVDVIWWWLGGLNSYRRRPRPLVFAWHGFLIFIIFNATVVFATGFVRWAGLFLCFVMGLVWWRLAKNDSTREPAKYRQPVTED
jgi:hypothetical protein